jgi:hypothetical protein
MRARRQLRIIAASGVAVIALASARLVAWSSGFLRPGGESAGWSESLLLIASPTNMGPVSPLAGVGVFHAETGSFEQLFPDTLQAPTPAPDGRELYFTRFRLVGDQVRTSIADISSDTLRQRWSVDLAATPSGDARGPLTALAASRDRVYVALHNPHAGQPITILALDRVDGFERRRWEVPVGDRALRVIDLHVAPDGGRPN